MDKEKIKSLLKSVREGDIEIDEAMNIIKKLPYEDLGYAKIDTHRCIRQGVGEVIYCEGKTTDQIKGIIERLHISHENILATRATRKVYEAVIDVTDDCVFHETARIVVIKPVPLEKKGNIAVVCAGTSDIPVGEEAAVTAEVLGNRVKRIYDAGVAGIHRILDVYDDLFKSRDNACKSPFHCCCWNGRGSCKRCRGTCFMPCYRSAY